MKTTLAIFSLFILADSALSAATFTTIVPSANDLTSARVAKNVPITVPVGSQERQAIHYSWVLQPNHRIDPTDRPFQQQSRQYWLDVSAAELAKGVEIPLTAVGALLRISPLSSTKAAVVSMADIQLRVGDSWLPGEQVIKHFADTEALAEAGLSVPDYSVAFQLADAVGAKAIVLKAALRGATGPYSIHVYEPRSELALNLAATATHYLRGQPIRLHAGLTQSVKNVAHGGLLVAPDGRTYPLHWANTANGLEALVESEPLPSGMAGLWEARMHTEGEGAAGSFIRQARTSFAIAPATARISELTMIDVPGADEVRLAVAVETAVAGRYHAEAILHGRDADGELRPGVLVHSADWLDEGAQSLTLTFASADLQATGLRPPYELGHLVLKDQTRMYDLWRQARAAVIDFEPGLGCKESSSTMSAYLCDVGR